MKSKILSISLTINAFMALSFIMLVPAALQAGQDSNTGQAPTSLSQVQLEKLVQPIALYPDILLQQVLAAATFPEQVLDAAIYNEQGKEPKQIQNQVWDDSVKAVANYPNVLTMLASDLDWTISLGSAYVNQTDQLRKALQTMRARAKTVGNLNSTPQTDVIEEKNATSNTTIIRIEPAEPQVIYVPTSSTVVYQEPVSTSSLWAPVATFGLGMAVGYAMGDDHDDNNYYYGGYRGPGFWGGGNAADDWVDYRRDRMDNRYDIAKDGQEWRQNNADDWREYRQDLGRKQQDWKNEAKNRGKNLSPEQRTQATNSVNNAKNSWNSKSTDQKKQDLSNRNVDGNSFDSDRMQQAQQKRQNGSGSFSKTGSMDRSQANARLQQSRQDGSFQQRANDFSNSPQARERTNSAWSSGQAQRPSGSSYSSGAGLSGLNSGSRSINTAQARGASSRSGFSSGSTSRGSSMSRSSFSGSSGSRGGGGGRRR